MDAAATRLHVRRYNNQAVGRESIRELLQTAMAAHSEGDERPWHFVVVEDLAMRERIAETHPAATIVVQAPVVILVCGDQTLQKHPGFWVQDCAAATENMRIKAQTMGLGRHVVWRLSRGRSSAEHSQDSRFAPERDSIFVDGRWLSGGAQRIEMPIQCVPRTFRPLVICKTVWHHSRIASLRQKAVPV